MACQGKQTKRYKGGGIGKSMKCIGNRKRNILGKKTLSKNKTIEK
jgi:hypothetical protein